MGKIQRKKSAKSKKKKKQKVASEVAAPIQADRRAGTEQVAVAEPSDKDVKKKPAVPQKKAPAASSVAPSRPKTNFLTATMQFLREVKVELKKVTWPSRKQTIGSTAVVLALVMLISLFLGVVDVGLSNLIRIVLQ
jgi:preprotein translocase subunit SecE